MMEKEEKTATKQKNTKLEKRASFAQKHPKLNIVLGFILLAIIFMGAAILIKWLFSGFMVIISKVEKMDAVVITTIIAGAVSIVGVVISSIVGKCLEFKRARQEYLAQRREEPYGDFTKMVYKLLLHSKNGTYTQAEMVKDLSSFSREITLWGSKEVVTEWVQFRKNANTPEGAKKNLLLIDDIMNAMRKDLGVKKVRQKDLISFFINDPENIKLGAKQNE